MLLTTSPDNAGSIKVIEKHGGQLAARIADPDGGILYQYWIDLAGAGERD